MSLANFAAAFSVTVPLKLLTEKSHIVSGAGFKAWDRNGRVLDDAKSNQGLGQWKISTLTIEASICNKIRVLAQMLGSFDAHGQGLWRLTSDMSSCTDSNYGDNKVHKNVLHDLGVVGTHGYERGRQI